MLSQSMCISHHQDVHFKYLKSFFVNYTSAKLEGKKRKESPRLVQGLSENSNGVLTSNLLSPQPHRGFQAKGKASRAFDFWCVNWP